MWCWARPTSDRQEPYAICAIGWLSLTGTRLPSTTSYTHWVDLNPSECRRDDTHWGDLNPSA